MKKLSIILLAAGSSRRFGGDKLIWPIDGVPMLDRIVQKLLPAAGKDGRELIVVSKPGPAADRAARLGAKVVLNPDAEQGISTSIRAGLTAADNPAYAAFFVADQPYLSEDTIEGFLAGCVSCGKGLGCVSHDGETGNPAAFAKTYFSDLLSLEGDRGGKAVIRRHPEDLWLFEVEDPRELSDIDTRDNA